MFVNHLPEDVIVRFSNIWSICIFTGAGISVESGVPSFRGQGAGGYFQGLPPDYLYSEQAWRRSPELVNQFWHNYRKIIQTARPGITHQTLHAWEMKFFVPRPPYQFTLLTQNIDGLHQAMGNKQVIELHGNIWRMRCNICQLTVELVPFSSLLPPNSCSVCDGELRPDVVLVGECISESIYRHALNAAETSAIFLAIGVSGVSHLASLLVGAARRKNRFLIEVNPKPTYLSHLFDITILGRAEDILPQFPWDHKLVPRY
ncbi:MAG: Sir2 family NAD-dependent protein deacetylase [Acidobacteriota bacterium]